MGRFMKANPLGEKKEQRGDIEERRAPSTDVGGKRKSRSGERKTRGVGIRQEHKFRH